MIDENVNPLTPRQRMEYENIEGVIEIFGTYDQADSHYQAVSHHIDEGMICANCVLYEADGVCDAVSGVIAPEGLCRLYVIPDSLMNMMAPDQPVVPGVLEPIVDVQPMVDPQPVLDGYMRSADGMNVPEREVRKLEKLEVRATPDGGAILEGYATVYNFAYDLGGGPDAGGFTEIIASGAAAKSAAEADVRLLVNHDGIPVARTKSGTMVLTSDDIGLKVQATLDPMNPVAASLRSAMERGDMDQMSFAFKVVRDSWDPQMNVRTIQEVKLFDVSMVTYPANPATVAKVRSDDTQDSEKATGRSVEMAKRQLEAISARR